MPSPLSKIGKSMKIDPYKLVILKAKLAAFMYAEAYEAELNEWKVLLSELFPEMKKSEVAKMAKALLKSAMPE